MVEAQTDPTSPFMLLDHPTTDDLRNEGPVRYLLVSGRQDDGLWGPVGALWLSEDGLRGGFLVSPWALWAGSEIVRGQASATRRGWTPEAIYRYWQREVWRGTHAVDEERRSRSLALLSEVVSAL